MTEDPAAASAAVSALLSFVFAVLGFTLGAIPFSVIIGRYFAKADIRLYGDGSPDPGNVLRAAGWKAAALAFLLDYLKGAIPVGIAWFWVRLQGNYILPVALAPLLGHAFSPFLRWRGGKTVAVTFGVWTGLTLGVGPTVWGLLLGVLSLLLASTSWAVVISALLFGGFVFGYYAIPLPEIFAIWLGNFAILLVKHYPDLSRAPQVRSALLQRVGNLVRILPGTSIARSGRQQSIQRAAQRASKPAAGKTPSRRPVPGAKRGTQAAKATRGTSPRSTGTRSTGTSSAKRSQKVRSRRAGRSR